MPITQVECPACGLQPLRHFIMLGGGEYGNDDPGAKDGCPLSPSERNWYRYIITHELSDSLHRDGTLTPTRLLTCPREVLFSDFLSYTLHLSYCHSTAVGTKFHEATSRSPLRLRGRLLGLDMEGECDNHQQQADGTWWIDDTKSHSDFGMARLRDKGQWDTAGDELRVQLSIYKLLFEQMWPERSVSRLTASHFSPYFGFRVVEIPAMSEEEIGEVRPLGNPFTVRQFAGFYVNALEALGDPTALGETIAAMVPAVGREMLKQKGGNSWKCDHCHHRKVCDGLG